MAEAAAHALKRHASGAECRMTVLPGAHLRRGRAQSTGAVPGRWVPSASAAALPGRAETGIPDALLLPSFCHNRGARESSSIPPPKASLLVLRSRHSIPRKGCPPLHKHGLAEHWVVACLGQR